MTTPTRHVVWAEVRCDLKSASKCHEGMEGDWVNGTRDIQKMIRAARDLGWDTSKGNTICPACKKTTTNNDS